MTPRTYHRSLAGGTIELESSPSKSASPVMRRLQSERRLVPEERRRSRPLATAAPLGLSSSRVQASQVFKGAGRGLDRQPSDSAIQEAFNEHLGNRVETAREAQQVRAVREDGVQSWV